MTGKDHIRRWLAKRRKTMTDDQLAEELAREAVRTGLVKTAGELAKGKAKELGVDWSSDPLDWLGMARAAGKDGGEMTVSEILEAIEIELRAVKYRQQIEKRAKKKLAKKRGRPEVTPEEMERVINLANNYDSDAEAARTDPDIKVSASAICRYRKERERPRIDF